MSIVAYCYVIALVAAMHAAWSDYVVGVLPSEGIKPDAISDCYTLVGDVIAYYTSAYFA